MDLFTMHSTYSALVSREPAHDKGEEISKDGGYGRWGDTRNEREKIDVLVRKIGQERYEMRNLIPFAVSLCNDTTARTHDARHSDWRG